MSTFLVDHSGRQLGFTVLYLGFRRRRQQDCMSVYLLSGPFWQAALVQVADAVGVRLYRFFFKVAHKRVAQLGGHHVCHKVGIEEDALQERERNAFCCN